MATLRHALGRGLIIVVTLVALVAIGCSRNGYDLLGIGPSVNTGTSPAAGAADVAFSFQADLLGSPTAFANVKAGKADAQVTFRLLTLNLGNPANPTTATEQTLLVPPSGRVTATFTAVPIAPTIAQVEAVGAVIGSYSNFHGARDLHAGANVITVAPTGSSWRYDLAAHILETAIINSSIFARLPASASALALEMADSINRSAPTAQQDAVRAFTRVINPPRWSLTADAVRGAQTQLLGVSGQAPTSDNTWGAGETFITETIGQDEVAGMCGWTSPTEFQLAANVKSIAQHRPTVRGAVIPRNLDWRNKEGKNWLSPVKNQYPYSTCVAFACCAALEAMMKIQANIDGIDLSEWHLFRDGNVANLGSLTRGWDFRSACEQLKTTGIAAEGFVPYYLIPRYIAPPGGARIYKADNYVLVQGVDGIKQALQEGPVVTGMRVYEDFMRYTGGIYWHATGREAGFHAILLVGYNDEQGCWLAKNSWSTGWGESGYFRIRYDQVQTDRGYLLKFAYATPAPAAPTNVTVAPGNTEVTVSWTPSAGATAHHLYYGLTTGVGRSSGMRVANVTTPYRLTGLRNDSAYYFVMTAENGTGESGESPEVSGTPRNPAQLTPANVVATGDDSQVSLTWSAVSQASVYRVYWSTTSGNARAGGQYLEAPSASYVHAGRANGTTYYYQVAAVVGGVESAASPEVSARAWPQIPTAPTGVQATAGNGQVTIAWQPVSGATSYRVYYSNLATVNRNATTKIETTSSPCVHTPLPNNNTVYYVVTALNVAGESPESTPVGATPTLPSPTNVTVARASTQCSLSWNAVPGAVSYNVYYRDTATALRLGTKLTTDQTTAALTGLINGRTSYFVVSAVDQNLVESIDSSVVSDSPALAAPANLRVTGTRGRITLTWDAATVIPYSAKVYYSRDGGATWNATTHLEGTTTGITSGADRSLTWVSHLDFNTLEPQSRVRVVLNDGVVDSAPTDSSVLTLDNRALIVNVTATANDGIYGIGAAINVTVKFSTVMRVTGTPQLMLETGATDRPAAYISGDNSDTLTFQYIVQAGDVSPDLDYTDATTFNLNGGTIRDEAGNNAELLLPTRGGIGSLGANKALVIDGVAPSVVSVTSTTNDGLYGQAKPINVTVNFSEPVTMSAGTLDIALDSGTTGWINPFSLATTASTTYVVNPGQASLDLDSTGLTLSGGATVRDAAGNNCVLTIPAGQSLKDSRAIVVETTGPTVSSVVRQTPTGANTNAANVTWRVTFSEPVNDTTVKTTYFTVVDVGNAISGEFVSAVSKVNSTTWDVTAYTGSGGDGALRLDLLSGSAMIQDVAGNMLAGNFTTGETYNLDKTPPTLVSILPFGPGDIDVTFSEPMGTGVTTPANYTVSGSGRNTLAASPDAVTLVGTNTYRLRWNSNSMASGSTITVSAATAQDVVGNAIAGSPAVTDATPETLVDTVLVGDVGNAADASTYGSVGYEFRIGKTEITCTQYCAFLNAVAKTDTYGLWYSSMAGSPYTNRGGIGRAGTSGTYTYTVVARFNDVPVNYVSFYGVVRFVNWLHNGARVNASTETGAYTITGGGDNSGAIGARLPGARYCIPTENEWYKAAYHDPNKGGAGVPGYWLYATRSDSAPTMATTDGSSSDVVNFGTNVANYGRGADWNGNDGHMTSVGQCGLLSESAYRTADQAGNHWEWLETIHSASNRVVRGGCWNDAATNLRSSVRSYQDPTARVDNCGFRVGR